MDFSLFEARELDQNCLRFCVRNYVEGQTQSAMRPVEVLLFISLDSDLFCTYLTSSALTGVTLMLVARADEVLCCVKLRQDHTLHQQALLDKSSPATCLALLQYASICPLNCWELYHVDESLKIIP